MRCRRIAVKKVIILPTIFRHEGFRYQISQDHPPSHIHVKGAGCEAKVLFDPVAVADSAGFTPRQLSRITAGVRARRREPEEAGHRLLGKPEG